MSHTNNSTLRIHTTNVVVFANLLLLLLLASCYTNISDVIASGSNPEAMTYLPPSVPVQPLPPLPTPTQTPQGYTLPANPSIEPCIFAPPVTGILNEAITGLDSYSFSAPQVVLTSTAPVDIQQWLPDSETLLITRESLSDQFVSVELLNANTGKTTEIIEPRNYLRRPRWLPANDTFVWRQIGSVQDNESGYWARSSVPIQEIRLSTDGAGAGISGDIFPNGKEFVFMSAPSGTQPFIWNHEDQTLDAIPIDLAEFRYEKFGIIYPLQPFNIHMHPAGDKILFQDGTWIFLYDLTTNSVCEIDMVSLSPAHPAVHEASWSPDGRYLLMKTSFDPLHAHTQGTHGTLLVLDTYTGDAVKYSLGNIVYGFFWGADSQTVAMTGQTEEKIGIFDLYGTYLLNVRSGEYRQILTEDVIVNGKWSPDGKRLAFNCIGVLPGGFELNIHRVCTSNIVFEGDASSNLNIDSLDQSHIASSRIVSPHSSYLPAVLNR